MMATLNDFGEDLDANSSRYLADSLRTRAGQVWLSTRRAAAAEAFAAEELTRLVGVADHRKVFQARRPRTKPERIAAQFISRQLLPEVASRALVVGEGPHDRTSLNALARKLFNEGAGLVPAAAGISIIDAAAGDDSGGIGGVPKLTAAARQLGFRTVAIIDWDADATLEQHQLNAAVAAADCVVRLPEKCAIEAALLHGLPDKTIVDALQDLDVAFGLNIPSNVFALTGTELIREAVKILKRTGGGFHAQFIEALPFGIYPPLALKLLNTAAGAAAGTQIGLIQL